MPSTLRLNLSRRTLAPLAGEEVWEAAEIARRLRGRGVLGEMLRYDDVRLALDDVEETLTPRPLIAARLLSRGRAAAEDARGRVRSIGWGDALGAAAGAAAGALAWPGLERAIRQDLARLGAPGAVASPRGEAALVVRTDLWFGLEAGGAIAHTAGVLNALAAQEPVQLLTSHDLPMLTPEIERAAPRRRWRALPRSEQTLLAYNRDLIRAGAEMARPAFVYQRHGLYGYAGAVLAQHFGAPLVLEYNGSEVWIGDHWGQPVPAREIALEIERRMLGAAHLVTAVSKPLVEQAIALGAPAARVLLSPNAADTERYRPDLDGSAVRARYGLGDAVVIGFIGTFGAWHGASVLAAAFAEMAAGLNVRLLMIGDGYDLPAARAAIERAGLAAKAVFTGLIPQAEGPAHLAAADVLVSPTLANPDGTDFFGSPTKLYEYMAMGRAIVASDLAQLGEVLRHEHTALLTPPGDRAALAAALTRVAEDGDLRRALGRAARAEAVTQHTWGQRAGEMRAALEALI